MAPVPVKADAPEQVTIWLVALIHNDVPANEDRLFKAIVEFKLAAPLTDRVFKLVSPVTFNPFNAPKPVIEAPTPTLPEVVKVVELIEVAFNPARLDNPAIFSPPNPLIKPLTVNEPPTPTLPVVTSDPPTPKLPTLAVPSTWKLNAGLVVPTPTLPLSKTVNPWVKFDPVVCSVIPVEEPNPFTVNAPISGPDVPTPTLPVPAKMEKELLELVVIDGVVPENVRAELFPDKVKVGELMEVALMVAVFNPPFN